jgi:hypothetical protein
VKYDAKNIERAVLNTNYLNFGTTDPVTIDARYDLQARLPVAIFDAVNSRPIKLGKLVANLSAVAKGRHLLAYSSDPWLQLVWRRAGLDGAVPDNGLMVALQNISANKLDYYIRPVVRLKTLSERRGIRRVEMKVTFSNKRRNPTSDVIEGIAYNRTHGMDDGEHRVFLTAYLPGTVADVASADPPFSTAGTDSGMKVVGFRYGVKVGETRTVTITFSVPKDQVFTIIPSARVVPMKYITPKGTLTDAVPISFKL